jgi:hypothetical protein
MVHLQFGKVGKSGHSIWASYFRTHAGLVPLNFIALSATVVRLSFWFRDLVALIVFQYRKSLDTYANGHPRPVNLKASKYRQIYNHHLAALHQYADSSYKSYLQAYRVKLTETLR